MKFDKLQFLTLGMGGAVILALAFLAYSVLSGKNGHAALGVELLHGEGNVNVDGKDYGTAPVYTEDVYAKDLLVNIDGSDISYSTTIRPSAGTLAVVKRDLGVSDYFSSGQNVWFEQTGGDDAIVSVVSSNTSDVSVIVEGVEVGKTPVRFSTKDLLSESDDNKYEILFSKEGFDDQVLNVVVKKGYTLNISLDMFLNPFPESVNELAAFNMDNVTFLNLSNVDGAAFVDRQAWAKAINYWLKTRGVVTLSEHKIENFNYFITDEGKVFNETGNEIKPEEIKTDEAIMIAYLGSSDKEGLSDKAKEAVAKATGKAVVDGNVVNENSEALGKVKVKDTGIGHLNIRSGPGVSNGKVGQVAVGETFDALDKKNGWTQIEYESGKKGWAIDTYLSTVN